ncbi:hypothetical protein BHE74_00034213, partial [Ensete ventricosum]
RLRPPRTLRYKTLTLPGWGSCCPSPLSLIPFLSSLLLYSVEVRDRSSLG